MREYSYNDEIGRKFLEGVSKGLPCNSAARYARVPPATMVQWLKWGEEGKDPVLRKLYEDYSHTFAVRTLEVIKGLKEEAYIYKALQAFNNDFNPASKMDITQSKTTNVDWINEDTMIANIEEVIRERKKRNSE